MISYEKSGKEINRIHTRRDGAEEHNCWESGVDEKQNAKAEKETERR